MAKDVFAILATRASVEREFTISSNIVNHQCNCINPKTISDLIQYKCWVAYHGTIAKITVDNLDDEIDEVEDDFFEFEDTIEELVVWLRTWEQSKALKKQAERLASI